MAESLDCGKHFALFEAEYHLSDKIFLHYPPCASKAYEEEFDGVIRKHPTLSLYREKVHISSTAHAIAQMRHIDPLRSRTGVGRYPLYALLYMLVRFRLPPRPSAIARSALFQEDMFKLRYHFRELGECAEGVFVPRDDGMWQYDMWRNAQRIYSQGKPVWQITGNRTAGWRITKLDRPPSRSMRLGRKETMDGVGTYAEPKKYPSLFTLVRDLLKTRD